MDRLPVIDVEKIVSPNCSEEDWNIISKEIGDACLNYGFFYVKNHGVDKSLVKDVFDMGHQFFLESEEVKSEILMKYAGKAFRGYFKLGGELTSNKPDWKAGLYFGTEIPPDHSDNSKPMHGQNLWHSKYPQMKHLILSYMESLCKLGHILMEAIARSLGLNPKFYYEKFTANPFTPFRLFYYPEDPTGIHEDDKTERWGVGEHTDYGVLTLLAQDEVGGLQVRNKATNGWIEAPPIEDTFVVNIGDMLDIWTGGKYKATPHRVKNCSHRNRLSAPFFFDPCFDAIIEPPPRQNDTQEVNGKVSPWSKPFPYGSYIHNKVLHNFPELADETNAKFYDL